MHGKWIDNVTKEGYELRRTLSLESGDTFTVVAFPQNVAMAAALRSAAIGELVTVRGSLMRHRTLKAMFIATGEQEPPKAAPKKYKKRKRPNALRAIRIKKNWY